MKLLILLFLICLSQAQKNAYITQTYLYERQSGIWSQWISAQPQSKAPPQYFVCGFAIRQMIWKKTLFNCGCTVKCSFCQNTFYTMANSIKLTFCHYKDWNKQIQKTFETTKANSGAWRQFKCPIGTYATKAASKFGFIYETDLGFNGLQLFCQENNLKLPGTLIQDTYEGWISPMSKARYGSFISAVQLKYETEGKLTGTNFGFSPMTTVTKIVFEFGMTTSYSIIVPLKTSIVENYGNQSIQKMVDFKQTVLTENNFVNNLAANLDFEISPMVLIEQYESYEGILISDAKRPIINGTFAFNKIFQSQSVVEEHICLTVGICKSLKITSVVNLLKATTPYTVEFSYENRITKESLGKSDKLQGQWTGTLVDSIRSISKEQNLSDCGQLGTITTSQS